MILNRDSVAVRKDYIKEHLHMSNRAMSLMKAAASSFYAGMMRQKKDLSWEPERAPMTVVESPCREQACRNVSLRQETPVDVAPYLSAEEKSFIRELMAVFQLNEDDLHLFHLVGYVRYANKHEMRDNPEFLQDEMSHPCFSPEFLTFLMECVQPSISSSRGYYAAMLHLKHHPVPNPWRADGRS